MTENDVFEKIIVPTFKQCAQTTPHFQDIQPTLHTELYGTSKAHLDSMGLVAFIFALEEQISAQAGSTVEFGTDEIIDKTHNHFSNVQSLIQLIQKKLTEGNA